MCFALAIFFTSSFPSILHFILPVVLTKRSVITLCLLKLLYNCISVLYMHQHFSVINWEGVLAVSLSLRKQIIFCSNALSRYSGHQLALEVQGVVGHTNKHASDLLLIGQTNKACFLVFSGQVEGGNSFGCSAMLCQVPDTD